MQARRGFEVLAGLALPQSLDQVGNGRIAAQHKVAGGLFGGVHFLRHVGNAQPFQALDVAAVRGQVAQQQREQAGLAAAVGADEGDMLPGLQGDAGAAEQSFAAPPEGDIP